MLAFTTITEGLESMQKKLNPPHPQLESDDNHADLSQNMTCEQGPLLLDGTCKYRQRYILEAERASY